MSDTETFADKAREGGVSEAAAPVQAYSLPLGEWCAHHSTTDRRPELIGAFFQIETAAGRTQAMAADFLARFAAFANAPA